MKCCLPSDCGVPLSITNGTVETPNGTTYGQEAVYTCNNGYDKFGSTQVLCTANGVWSELLPSCRKTSCGSLSNPNKGIVRASETTFGEIATYICFQGYTLNGTVTRTCQANGSWSGLAPVCDINDCGRLPSPTNGSVEFNATTFMSIARYRCDTGFTLQGFVVRICQQTSEWSDQPPSCQIMNCGSPPALENGGLLALPETTVYGTLVTYICNIGYEPTGDTNVTCTETRAWSKLPTCQLVDCGPLPDIENGQSFTFNGTEYGAIGVYVCETGYLPNGTTSLTCLASKEWSSEPPTCDIADCGPLPNVTNGVVFLQGTQYRDTAQYTCDTGHQINGSTVRLCQADQTWSGTEPNCTIRDCGPVSGPKNGKVILTSNATTYGSVAEFSCIPKHEILGSSSIVCRSDGTWSGQTPTCQLAVGFREVATEVTFNLTVPASDDLRNQSTYESYVQEVRNKLLAFYRKLLGFDIDIIIDDIRNGSLIVDFRVVYPNETAAGQELSVATQNLTASTVELRNQTVGTDSASVNNLPITGASADLETLLCIAYQATIGACSPGYLCSVENNLPNCRPDPTTDCGQPLGIANGQVEVLNGTLYSAKATYTCNVGFTLKGDSIRTCEPVGSWSNAEPTCRVTDCGTLTAPANGEVFAPGGTIYGRIANYNCDPGFSIIGAISVTCEKDGAWSSDPPVCRDTRCGSLVSPGNGSVFLSTDGNTAVYSCKEGFDLDGAALHTCLASNIWSGDPPTCQAIDCGTLPNPAKGSVDQTEGTLYGATVTYSCVIFGYKLNGSDTRTCKLDGTWSGTELTCEQIDCGPLIAPEDGNLVLSGTLLKNTGIYSCNLGYQLQGQATLTCQESGWSHPAPICLASGDCGVLTIPVSGQVAYNKTTYGAQANYTCLTGYRLEGPESRICQLNNTWSGSQPVCSIIDCGLLSNPAGGSVALTNGTTYGKIATITCSSGHTLVGPATVTCLKSQQWSHNSTCQIQDCRTLPNPSNGAVDTVAGTTFGSTAQYSCNPGYSLQGHNSRTCQETGQWSSTAPTCNIKDCKALADPTNGNVDQSQGTKYGQTVTYTCRAGYQIVGMGTRLCEADGQWTGSPPTCVQKLCGVLSDPANGRVSLSQDRSVGSVATYTCNTGFKILNASLGNTRTCGQDSQWTGNAPTCVAVDCGPLSNPSSGLLELSAGTGYGSSATYTCNKGYMVKGPSIRICLESGNWSRSPPDCAVTECSGQLSSPRHGKVRYPDGALYGSEVVYSCESGYQLRGDVRRRCLTNGSWDGVQPRCKKIDEYGLAIGLGVGLSGTIILIILGVALCMLYRRYFIHQHRPTKTKILVPTYSIPAYPETQYMEAPSLPLKMTASGATTSHYVPLGFSHNRAVTVEDNESSFSERRTLDRTYNNNHLPGEEYFQYYPSHQF
ncbi:sushi, von Willebrand factor type A, EGF and pentraxin domain-containing protein 1-like [Mya arenaria]|uniref:sushi, von Willebrand factor type A, EGF and pentraxin domain-containing protein 1-like n=1 Tax=Mya arenaria TaxID=6604 RepID=UPI0022E566AC|nr:sushi, von Willebrand factor type A, EGF and pentraxin domain-containing protein 1-like [Mya arenaria]